MRDIDFYLTYAHSARNRAMYISVLIGASAGAIAELTGASFGHAVIACVIGSFVSEVLAAALYVKPKHKEERAIIQSPQRRELIPALAAAVIMFVFALLRIPRLEAAVIERKLIHATAGPPPYDKANVLIRTVLENNVRLSAKGMAIVKQQLAPKLVATNPAEPLPAHEKVPANLTYADLEGYNIYNASGVKLRLPFQRVVVLGGIYSVNGTIEVNWGPTVGQSRTQSGIRAVEFQPNSPAIFSYAGNEDRDAFVAHMTVLLGSGPPPSFIQRGNSSSKLAVFDVTVSSLKQALDRIIWAEVVFDHCQIAYDGGPLLLKDVSFKNCQFSAGNVLAQGLVETIRSYGDNPVTLTFP